MGNLRHKDALCNYCAFIDVSGRDNTRTLTIASYFTVRCNKFDSQVLLIIRVDETEAVDRYLACLNCPN